MTGNTLLAELRMRLNDQGDDTQLSDGAANKQYYWSTTELLLYLNEAQFELYNALIDLRRDNELKGLLSSTTASTVPADFYAPFVATIDGVHAQLVDDPRDMLYVYNGRTKCVTIAGNSILRTGGAAHVVHYYKRPASIAASDTAITEMTRQFYEAALDLAEMEATHKDNAQARTVLRRQFGSQDIQMLGPQKYLQQKP